MGWLGSMFGSRRRREAARELEAQIEGLLERAGPEPAWARVVTALLGADAHEESQGLLRLAARVLRERRDPRTAELFDRAADAPHDPQRLFELGSTLLSDGHPELAAAVLERALAFMPFDAVVRSELALAHARSGRPDRVLETLALHPCLADDPGALFEFGWAALLSADLAAAEGTLGPLSRARALHDKLAAAIERARLVEAAPEDARDFYFVEHGGLLLDATGPLGGRHDALMIEPAWAAAAIGDLGAHLREAIPAPRRVTPVRASEYPLAEAVARACEGAVIAPGRGRLPAGVAVTMDAAALDELDDASWHAPEIHTFALTMDWTRSAPRAPDILGAFARVVTVAPDAFRSDVGASGRAMGEPLARFVEPRRAHLAPRGRRPRGAFVPDAPLPRSGS